MTDHWNFQEWLYIGRILKICTTFKFSYFVVRSLLSTSGPYDLCAVSLTARVTLTVTWMNKQNDRGMNRKFDSCIIPYSSRHWRKVLVSWIFVLCWQKLWRRKKTLPICFFVFPLHSLQSYFISRDRTLKEDEDCEFDVKILRRWEPILG